MSLSSHRNDLIHSQSLVLQLVFMFPGGHSKCLQRSRFKNCLSLCFGDINRIYLVCQVFWTCLMLWTMCVLMANLPNNTEGKNIGQPILKKSYQNNCFM